MVASVRFQVTAFSFVASAWGVRTSRDRPLLSELLVCTFSDEEGELYFDREKVASIAHVPLRVQGVPCGLAKSGRQAFLTTDSREFGAENGQLLIVVLARANPRRR